MYVQKKERMCCQETPPPPTKKRRNDEIMYKVSSRNVGMLRRKKLYGMNYKELLFGVMAYIRRLVGWTAGYPRSRLAACLLGSLVPLSFRDALESWGFCGVQSTSMSESLSLSAFEDVAGVGSPPRGCCCCCCGCCGCCCCCCCCSCGAALLLAPTSVSFFVPKPELGSLRCLFHSSDIERMRAVSSSR